ncbi:MAG: AMP-binding protein [Coriobacteriia bacterium]|nr:AMP-binding protein [Coriobacteriia bacterium]
MERYRDFGDLIDRMAFACPGKVALRGCDERGELRDVTWSELQGLVCERADALAPRGGECEAVLADGSIACVIEVFAAVRAGLQVALADPFIPNAVLMPLLASVDAGCAWAPDAARQAEIEGQLAPAAAPAHGAHAVLFFTSGTTSQSKAVVLTDESLMASAFNGSSLLPLSPDDTLLCLLPLSHVFGFVCGLLWGLACGATVALGRGPRYYAADLALFDPTTISAVPRLLEFLVARQALNPGLRLVLVGAADCADALLDAVRARGIRASLGYGLTETSSGVALSVGDDFHAMTVCPEDRVTISEEGEILVSAPTCLMQGYYRDDAKTAAAVREGILHTGDQGFLDADGLLHVQGRLKDVIVLPNGTKVFLPEYEAAVAGALHEADVAVVLHGGKLTLACGRLVAARTDRELMDALAPALASYPPGSRIERIARLGHALPRTASGDVERWKILEELD